MTFSTRAGPNAPARQGLEITEGVEKVLPFRAAGRLDFHQGTSDASPGRFD